MNTNSDTTLEEFIDANALDTWSIDVYSCERKSYGCFILETGSGCKRLTVDKTPDNIYRLIRTTDHLTANGFTNISRPILNRYGDAYATGANGYYCLCDSYTLPPPDCDNEQQLKTAGAFLAQFHLASRGFFSGGRQLRLSALPAAHELLSCQHIMRRDTSLRREIPFLYNEMAEVLRLISPEVESNLEYKVRRAGCFCLGGGLMRSLCIDKAGELLLTDLDNCLSGAGACDLAELLLAGLPHSAAILNAYIKIRPLPHEEKRLLLAAVLTPHEAIKVLRGYKEGKYTHREMLTRFAAATLCEHEKKSHAKAITELLKEAGDE